MQLRLRVNLALTVSRPQRLRNERARHLPAPCLLRGAASTAGPSISQAGAPGVAALGVQEDESAFTFSGYLFAVSQSSALLRWAFLVSTLVMVPTNGI